MAKLIALSTLVIVLFASLARAGDVTSGTITKTPKPGNNTEVVVEGTLTLGATETWNGWEPYMIKLDGVTIVTVMIVEFTQPAPGETKNFKYKQTVNNANNDRWSAVATIYWNPGMQQKTAGKGFDIP